MVGTVAVAVGLLVLASCGGSGGDKAEGKPAATSSTPGSDESAAPESAEPEYPPGPEGAIDRKADTEGWTYDDSTYASASEFVQDICDSLPEQSKNWSPAQWLAEGGYMDADGQKILKFGVPKLCPKWMPTVKAAVSGDYERYISSGEYEVKAHPKPSKAGADVEEVAPGTYRATGRFEDCYWERTAANGDIIANQFVTQARELTVTLRAGELFKNDCGTFKPVG